MEPVRPHIDGLVIKLVEGHALQRSGVYETREGLCRIGPPLVRRLAAWAPDLRDPLEVHARALIDLVVDGEGSPPAHKRSPLIAGKGGKRRQAARALG
jgi:hypothetical protein